MVSQNAPYPTYSISTQKGNIARKMSFHFSLPMFSPQYFCNICFNLPECQSQFLWECRSAFFWGFGRWQLACRASTCNRNAWGTPSPRWGHSTWQTSTLECLGREACCLWSHLTDGASVNGSFWRLIWHPDPSIFCRLCSHSRERPIYESRTYFWLCCVFSC